MFRLQPIGLLLGACAATFAWSGPAHADTLTIKTPGVHPHYKFDAEPHLLLGLISPPGPAHAGGFGAGFRASITLLENGFVPKINNSVGIGFGMDLVHYTYEWCARPQGNTCAGFSDTSNYIYFPVVMQWNFFLSQNWSVFGEPGFGFHYNTAINGIAPDFLFFVGGRWHFSRSAALTMRLGYPYFSIGVSFLM
jgi:hypothetical protein